MNAIMKNWPVLFRATLYFLIAALPVMIEKLNAVVNGEVKVVPVGYWWLAGVAGIYQGLVSLRAYYDGSAQRHSDEQDEKDKTT